MVTRMQERIQESYTVRSDRYDSRGLGSVESRDVACGGVIVARRIYYSEARQKVVLAPAVVRASRCGDAARHRRTESHGNGFHC